MKTRTKLVLFGLAYCTLIGVVWGRSRALHPRLDVSVRTRAGGCPRTGWLMLVDRLDKPRFKRFCQPRQRGEFRLERVPPGRYWIRAYGDFEATEVPVQVRADRPRQHIRIVLE